MMEHPTESVNEGEKSIILESREPALLLLLRG